MGVHLCHDCPAVMLFGIAALQAGVVAVSWSRGRHGLPRSRMTMIIKSGRLIALLVLALAVEGRAAAQGSRVPLTDGWQIQSSEKVKATGETISTAAFKPAQWYTASVPSTVLAALVAGKVYPDPFFGMNLRAIPGTGYPIGRNFSALAMPPDSPFRVSWWFRRVFTVPEDARGRRLALHFDGITYRANIWLNGSLIARSEDVAGTYRLYEFDITREAKRGDKNVVAVEVFPPEPDDLAWTWVDWNPAPPDKNMGLWRPVFLTTSGDVVIRNPHVVTQLDGGLERATLTVTAEMRNLAGQAVRARSKGTSRRPRSDRTWTRAGDEDVAFSSQFPPAGRAQAVVAAELGAQDLYRLDLGVTVAGVVSDRQALTFGIREIASTITTTGARLFTINGRRLLIRGGGWAPDMLLRASPERQDAELRYVRAMGLNTIRLEGKLDDDRFFDQADRLGILVLAGWCCCDAWEQPQDRKQGDCGRINARPDPAVKNAPEPAGLDERERQSTAARRRADVHRHPEGTRLAKSVRLVGDCKVHDHHGRDRREDDRAVRLGAAVLLAPGRLARWRPWLQYRD
jgi:exo-1,4-beta-D-glucosaminidase